ncbi:MAG: ATP-binding cassette domain-containing protein, partial [Pseudomonadota bacterium]
MATKNANGASGSKTVKVSCRNVWKVYGEAPDQFFSAGSGSVGDADAHAAKIRESGHIVAAANVSFDVHVGEIFVIMGLSGSGKSTLVRCFSRLHDITGGTISIEGIDIGALRERELIELRRSKMGMVFQSFGLLPHRTVLDNVAFPLEMRGQDRHDR